MSYRALCLSNTPAFSADVVTLDELPEGDVELRVDYSTLNYKDALAITNKSPIVRAWPMIAGIDAAGVVEHSTHPGFQAGDAVVLNGWGLGETRWGGLAQKTRAPGEWLVKLPLGACRTLGSDSENRPRRGQFSTISPGNSRTIAQEMGEKWAGAVGLQPEIPKSDRLLALTPRDAASIGTAGYTAAMCAQALERHGLTPGDGPILVTGATGGVGSIAVALLARAGFEVVAATGKLADRAYLERLGASTVIDRNELGVPGKPLQKERYAGVVDVLGSHALVNACAQVKRNGAVAACGLAMGMDLPASVAPFILRGVTLYGIDSVYASQARRLAAWRRLADGLDASLLGGIAREIGLADTVAAAEAMLAGRVVGRYLVDVNR